ncbi:MAG TPA: hypothetical protein VFO17_03300 [Acidimicrobiia bacterium]|nr:hypothetical protein [Acidimicrobiia bacterium]
MKWRADKPGLPEGPDDMPGGGLFGTIGPDPGWAVKLVNRAQLPEEDDDLRMVLTALVQTRSAALGRAPVREDLEVALILCGYGYDAPDWAIERRRRWLDAAHHEPRPGMTAVMEVDRDLLVLKPDRVRAHILESVNS